MSTTIPAKSGPNPDCLITVITVVYELDELFWVTAQSMAEQDFAAMEWVVKPATPVSAQAHEQLSALGVRIVLCSEPDTGIYNAMNVAVARSSGRYLFFLNSGDRFAAANLLGRVAEIAAPSAAVILYGMVRIGDTDHRYPMPLTRSYFFRNALCHQAYFVSRSLCDGMATFDESYRVLADHAFALRHLDEILNAHVRLPFRVTEVPEMGFSARNRDQTVKERKQLIRAYFPFAAFPVLHLAYMMTLPKLRYRLWRFSWYRQLRLYILNYKHEES